mmetsp:Transcript_19482/g.27860  ORF Transcript_19482/g.27860 Transcript_19482/m.27860 type:complete len:117 (+) Transcript_19482:835-1185(+)
MGGQWGPWPTGFCQPSAADYDACKSTLDAFIASRTLPFWLIPVVVVLTLPLAAATHRLVLEPCRAALKHNSASNGDAVKKISIASYANKLEDKETLLASVEGAEHSKLICISIAYL